MHIACEYVKSLCHLVTTGKVRNKNALLRSQNLHKLEKNVNVDLNERFMCTKTGIKPTYQDDSMPTRMSRIHNHFSSKIKSMLFAGIALSAANPMLAIGSEVQVTLPLTENGMSTYYANVAVKGTDERQYMVDTGAGYTTINKAMLEELKMHDMVEFRRTITAVMANGSETVVNIYSVSEITLGSNCSFKDVEVAVLPGTSRTILGMSLLKRAAPFTFNAEPPSLSLGSCDNTGNTVALGPDIDG